MLCSKWWSSKHQYYNDFDVIKLWTPREQTNMTWSLCVQWVQLRSEVIVHFVDIGGINNYNVCHSKLTQIWHRVKLFAFMTPCQTVCFSFLWPFLQEKSLWSTIDKISYNLVIFRRSQQPCQSLNVCFTILFLKSVYKR